MSSIKLSFHDLREDFKLEIDDNEVKYVSSLDFHVDAQNIPTLRLGLEVWDDVAISADGVEIVLCNIGFDLTDERIKHLLGELKNELERRAKWDKLLRRRAKWGKWGKWVSWIRS